MLSRMPNESLIHDSSHPIKELYLRESPSTDKDGNPIPATKQAYRVRLLAFSTENRVVPYIEKFEHVCWTKNEAGKTVPVGRITCPSHSRYARKFLPSGTDFMKCCPICNYAFEQKGIQFKVKGKSDPIAAKNVRDASAKWVAYYPVLVINDPNFPSNNGRIKAMQIQDKEMLNRINTLISEQERAGVSVFNGDKGVDLMIIMRHVEETALDKNGQPRIDKRTGNPVILHPLKPVKMGFVPAKYATEHPEITVKSIEDFQFDETFSRVPTADELADFMSIAGWKGGCSDLPDDIQIGGESVETVPETKAAVQPKPAPHPAPAVKETPKTAPVTHAATPVETDNELAEDPDNLNLDDYIDGKASANDKPAKPKVTIGASVHTPKDVATPAGSDDSGALDDLPF